MRRAACAGFAAIATAWMLASCLSGNDAGPGQGADASAPGVDASSGSDAPSSSDGTVETDASDATVADSSPSDAGAADTSMTDSGPDASDAAPDATDAAPDASDAGVDAASPFGFALQFDDTTQPQYVTVPDTARLNLTSAFTMEAWVNLTSAGHTAAAAVLAQPYGAGGTDTTTLWFESGALSAAVNLAGTSGADSLAWTAANGTWHHVAWTFYEATGLEILYVDGVDSAHQTSTAGVPVYDGHPLLIGSDIDFGAFTYGFDGIIDEVRIFSAVRSPGQIAGDMAGASPVADPTLVAYYPFDEGSGAVAHDASPNHFDGVLGGAADASGSAPAWVASTVPSTAPPADAGSAGSADAGQRYALQFDPSIASQYVAVADTAALHLTSAFTYEAWIDANGSLGSVVSVLGKPFGAGVADTLAIWFQGGPLYAAVNLAGTGGAVSYAWSLPNGAWHHVAWTFDGTTGAEILYVDGVSVGTATSTAGAPVYDTHPFLVGADINNGSLGYGFAGLIDDVRVFSSVRTLAQVQSDMSGASPVGDPALVAYYPFDEGSGLVAHDASGNHLDGTLGDVDAGSGVPTWVVSNAPF